MTTTTPTATQTRFSVKAALTAKRRNRTRRIVENHDYAAFLRRALRAHGRRIANHADVEALRQLVDLTSDLDDAIAHAVTGLRQHKPPNNAGAKPLSSHRQIGRSHNEQIRHH